jgi:aspartyl-tRNA(Asn)/glutamyl-tRNA(Gln) amidotransferase subunit B
MEQGSLRFEASVSLRPAGASALGARVEIKNLNSVKAVCGALRYEIQRQTRALEAGERLEQETRLWDEARSRTRRMRSKEEAHDYRYFPEPDLLPVEVDDAMLAAARDSLPEPPPQRRRRFVEQHGLSDYEASVLTDQREVADYFEAAVAAHDAPKSLANWIINEVLAVLNERRITVAEFELPPEWIADLVRQLDERKINAQAARYMMLEALEPTPEPTPTPDELLAELGLEQISDASALQPAVEQVLAENPKMVADYAAGKKNVIGALIGQVMRATRGKADPKLAREMLAERLDRQDG